MYCDKAATVRLGGRLPQDLKLDDGLAAHGQISHHVHSLFCFRRGIKCRVLLCAVIMSARSGRPASGPRPQDPSPRTISNGTARGRGWGTSVSNIGPCSRGIELVVYLMANMSERIEVDEVPLVVGTKAAIKTLHRMVSGVDHNRHMPVLMAVLYEEDFHEPKKPKTRRPR